jgi:predicted unusual protein kinase regulating ubiquinone biosynthesis (AarF/ABC1/UbiB family)
VTPRRDDEGIPTSRLSRSARVGRLAAGQAARQLGTRATNVARSEDGKRKALEKRQVETAEQIVAALGTMKGAAMKLGQVMSFLDVGLVPEEYREEFQLKLAALQNAAPKVAFKDMKKVLEREYGEKLDAVFASFDPVPIAAASIGQVYRASLPDGRDVAVKVQYPGVAQAVRADMQNLGMILRLMKSIAPGLDPKALGDEIRMRIGEELDYELEASNQRSLARIYKNHPFIVVPDVVTDLSHEKVVVSEFVDGRGFEEIKTLPQEERDRLGEIIFRFYFGCMYRHHQFSGDPHPGNSLLLRDGRMAFLDFGLFKRIPAEVADRELAMVRASLDGDAAALAAQLRGAGFVLESARYSDDQLLEQFRDLTWWYTTDEVVELDPEIATEVMINMSDPRSKHFAQMRHESLPPDHLFGRRLEVLTLAVLGQLRARANWFRIASEWIDGAEPETELGRAEAEFLARRS